MQKHIMEPHLQWPLILMVIFAISKLAHIFYRICLHPLSTFPGPRLAGASTWWEFYMDAFYKGRGKFYFELQKLHDRYGPIVRIAPNELHIRDATWTKVLYGSPGSVRHKAEWLALMFGTRYGTFGTANHYVHKARRKILQTHISRRAILSIESDIDGAVDTLCRNLERRSFEIINLRTTVIALTVDVNTRLLLGRPYGMLQDDERAKTWHNVESLFQDGFGLCKQFSWATPIFLHFRFLAPIVGHYGRAVSDLLRVYWEVYDRANESIQKYTLSSKLKNDEAQNFDTSLFERMLTSSLPPEEKSPLHLTHEVYESFVAGSAATARAICFTIYFILTNPDVKRKLISELVEAMPNPRVIPKLTTLESLPYLPLVIKEALRTSAFVTARMARVTVEPLQYKSWSIPPGTTISMTLPDSLLNEDVFPDPLIFRPERWQTQDLEHLQRMEEFFIPFGRGNRACVGMDLAYSQLHKAIPAILRRFNLELYDTIKERDIDFATVGLAGDPSKESKGIRVRIKEHE